MAQGRGKAGKYKSFPFCLSLHIMPIKQLDISRALLPFDTASIVLILRGFFTQIAKLQAGLYQAAASARSAAQSRRARPKKIQTWTGSDSRFVRWVKELKITWRQCTAGDALPLGDRQLSGVAEHTQKTLFGDISPTREKA